MSNATMILERNLGSANASEFPKIIRRDIPHTKSTKPRLVAWNGTKIEKAVNGACLEIGHEPVGFHIQAEIESRMKKERSRFIHIEELQDLVETLLIEFNYGRVALAYGKHRARRAALREMEAQMALGVASESSNQISSGFAEELRLRVSFGRIGLHLVLSDSELVLRLMRSVSPSLTPQEQKETIILNAKNLLDVDADSRFFAGRILLSYIYEETLPWKIADGIDQLKSAHLKAFVKYIPLGIKMGRLDPRLAEYNLEDLAKDIDPYADLQFDFIGIQNLYDRYLICVKDNEDRRRIEAPQIFWMRVAMGLALLEPERQKRAKEFFRIYDNKLACSSTPTLFNSGTRRPQLSSCYLLYCGDSIENISETWARFSSLSNWAVRGQL
jgi:ribonucleoside-diphosphate reductase alpha chain